MANDEDFADLEQDFHQNIVLNGREHAHTIHGFEVKICASEASSTDEVISGSSKVKISTITNQNWNRPAHHGKIVASNSQYLSYVLEGRNGYVLRLIKQEGSGKALLKGFVGAVVDVAFCHAGSNLLACVDQGGNLYIWDFDRLKDENQMQAETALKIVIHRSSTAQDIAHRLTWSPHVPLPAGEEEEDPDICNLVLTHGTDIEVFDILEIFSKYPNGMEVPREQLHCASLSIKGAHEKSISDLSLSPDGTVLATVSEDGHLKFWQVNLDLPGDPKCLHDFVPHQGAPVSRLIFCDNHLSQDPGNQYWRFLITAANNNTDIKIWCAVNWKCLQTIRLLPPQGEVEPRVVLDLDLSASYLVVADSNRKALLVLQLCTSPTKGDASVTSVTEYLLTQPVLSFTVSKSAPLSPASDQEGFSEDDSEEAEEEEEEGGNGKKNRADFDSRRNIVMLKLHCVQTRSMQELLVRFEPPDIFGVPPHEQPFRDPRKGDILESLSALVGAREGDILESLSAPVSSFAVTELSSLSTEVLGSTLNNTPPAPFQSLPLLNTSFGSSPKLLTPSEFTSPIKLESGLDEMMSSHSLLSPASIIAGAAEGGASTADVLPHGAQPYSVPQDTLSESKPPSASDVPSEPPVQFNNDNGELEVETDGAEIEPESGAVGEGSVPNGAGRCPARAEDVPLPLETSSEEEMPSAEDTQKAFESIMELIDGGPSSHRKSTELVQSSFDEFTELLTNPEKLQEQERELQSHEEALPKDEPEVSRSPVAGSDASLSTASFPDVLKSTSVQDPPANVAEGAGDSDGGGVDTQWPDLGAPEQPRETGHVDMAEAVSVKAAISNELFQVGVGEGLLMPSALTDMQDFHDNSVDTEVSKAAPDLLDQEVPTETKASFEAEEGVVRTKSRSRRRAKRGKKQNATGVGVTELLEAPSQSDGDSVQVDSAAVDLLPSMAPNMEFKVERGVDTAALSELTKLIVDQQHMMQELKDVQERNFQVLQDRISEVKSSVLEEQRAGLSEIRVDQQQRLDRVLKDKQTLDKQRQDKLITSLSGTLTTAVNAKLDKLIKTELKNSVLPVVLSVLREELSRSVADRLTATDVALKDGISRLVASKGLPDAVTAAMTTSLQQCLPAVFEQVFKTSVLPSFERSCQEMFRQIDESFRRGTVEFMSQLQEQQQQRESALHYLLSSFESVQSLVGKSLEASAPDQLQAIVHQEVANFSLQMKDMLTEVIHKEMQVGKGSLQKEEIKGQIQKHVQTKSYNLAFELALSTSDLQLVTYLCHQVDPDVFDKSPSLLSQPVLLSLIQQLSVNLEESLELKLKYLDQSLLALDANSEVTKNHMVPVIKQLHQQVTQLQEKMQADDSELRANPAISKQVKRLLMVAHHMCS